MPRRPAGSVIPKKVDYSSLSSILVPYRRVSTRDQGESGLGLEAQKTKLSAYLTYTDRTALTWDCYDVQSGKTDNREGLDKALELVRSGEAGGIAVSKLDRLSRSLPDFSNLVAAAREEGWTLVLLDINVDLNTPIGELLAMLVAAIAQFERNIIAERTRDALAELKAQGVQLGRPRLQGESLDLVLRLFQETGNYTKVARMLTAGGIPTAQGKSTIWYASAVHFLVNSALERE